MVGPFAAHGTPLFMPADFSKIGVPVLGVVSKNWTFAFTVLTHLVINVTSSNSGDSGFS